MLKFTDTAKRMVETFMESYGLEGQALRIAVKEGTPLDPEYEITLVGEGDRASTDLRVTVDGIRVLLDRESIGQLQGATVDYVERVNEAGFEIRRPDADTAPEAGNGAPDAAGGDFDDDDPLAREAHRVIEERINPAVAAHGGKITLVGVKDHVAHIEMSGGCQGCGMARATLKQGVERMLRDAVPEIEGVHDVTDHAAGDNPYY